MVDLKTFLGLTNARAHNSKNQLSQINSPTTMGCSLEYPFAKSTMKLEAHFFFFAEVCTFIIDEMHNLFLEFRALHKNRMKLAT